MASRDGGAGSGIRGPRVRAGGGGIGAFRARRRDHAQRLATDAGVVFGPGALPVAAADANCTIFQDSNAVNLVPNFMIRSVMRKTFFLFIEFIESVLVCSNP